MPDWADDVKVISEDFDNNKIAIVQFGNKKSFITFRGSNVFVMNERFDDVRLLNNALQTNDADRNTSLLVKEDNKQYIYNQSGQLISRKSGIDISLGTII
jgi:hypothetical protein